MKKFILLVLFFIVEGIILPVLADVMPLSTKSIKYYGIGVVNVPKSYTVYQNPSFNSEVIRNVDYDLLKKSAIVRSTDMKKVSYIAYVPSNNIALLTVDNNPENNWYCVFINQETGEKGWIYNDNKDDFMTYRQLFYRYGKKYGLRFFNDLTKDDKVLYSKEDKSSQIVDELSYPKYITFTVIRGNWILVSVNDMTKHAKVGWFNWRNDDGTLNMFPNFKEQP